MQYKNTSPLKKMLEECVDGDALADVLKCCTETLRRQGDQGKLPYVRVGQKRLYHLPTIMKSMMDHGEVA